MRLHVNNEAVKTLPVIWRFITLAVFKSLECVTCLHIHLIVIYEGLNLMAPVGNTCCRNFQEFIQKAQVIKRKVNPFIKYFNLIQFPAMPLQ